jgi:hypothetical protein
MPLIKMTYSNPEMLREVKRGLVERIPDHPKRPAREWEANTWEETIDQDKADDAVWQGHIVRHIGE